MCLFHVTMKMRQFLRDNILLIATVISVVLGVLIGGLCRPLKPSPDTILLVGFPGEIFLRMLKMLMLPLVVASIITGVGSLKGVSAGRMGLVAVLYYISSTVIALCVALVLALTIRPGANSEQPTQDLTSKQSTSVSGWDIFMDLIRNMIPDNIIGAAVQHSRTVMTAESSELFNSNEKTDNISFDKVRQNTNESVTKKIQLFDGANILGVLLYSVVFGVILSRMGRKGQIVTRLFDAVNNITFQMIRLAMWYSPVGIMFLITSQVMSSEDLSATARILGVYLASELSGMAIHFLLTLPAFYFILTRGNAFKVYFGSLSALVTALATSSSAATLPVTMRCMEKLKMDATITAFVLPIGATVNMDATAIYAVMGPVFIAQYNGVNLSFPDVLMISLTALLTSIGAAAVPGSAIAVLLLVLKSIGLPDRGLPLLFTIDWLADRVRTIVNVGSDCLAVGVTSSFSALPPQEENPVQETQHTTILQRETENRKPRGEDGEMAWESLDHATENF